MSTHGGAKPWHMKYVQQLSEDPRVLVVEARDGVGIPLPGLLEAIRRQILGGLSHYWGRLHGDGGHEEGGHACDIGSPHCYCSQLDH